jgi:D-3-phosphoglycerate dehydrogenase
MKVFVATRVNPLLSNQLMADGIHCVHQVLKNSDELLPLLPDFDGVIINSRFVIGKNFIDALPRLKFIARVGAGMENIDVDYLKEKNVACFNSPEGNRQAVGEHTLGLLLNLMNKISVASSEVRSGIWKREENRGIEINGKVVGIIGYGNMGSSFARCISGLGATVIAYDKYKFQFSDAFVKEASMDEIFETADILSLHVPLTNETKYMVDQNYIHSFKRNIFLLNTARGQVIDSKALVSGLTSGKIRGAGLDVLEFEAANFEKMNFSEDPILKYLLAAPNVIITPHIAGWSVESDIKHAEVLAKKILDFFRNE